MIPNTERKPMAQSEQTKQYLKDLEAEGKIHLVIPLLPLEIAIPADWDDDQVNEAIQAELDGACRERNIDIDWNNVSKLEPE